MCHGKGMGVDVAWERDGVDVAWERDGGRCGMGKGWG